MSEIVSAHRTQINFLNMQKLHPKRKKLLSQESGSASTGMVAANTWLPVLGVPVESKALKGMDSLLSIAQMPAGVPVGTLAIGEAGAKNAGLLAASILATTDQSVQKALEDFRDNQTKTVLNQNLK